MSPESHPLSAWAPTPLGRHSSLALVAPSTGSWLSQPGQTCPGWHASAVFFTMKPLTSACARASSRLYPSGETVAIGLSGLTRKVRVALSPSTAPSCRHCLVHCPIRPRADCTGHLPRRFWYHCLISCQAPSVLEAEAIMEERGQRWSLLTPVLTKSPANEEKTWTLHQAQFATEIGSTG